MEQNLTFIIFWYKNFLLKILDYKLHDFVKCTFVENFKN